MTQLYKNKYRSATARAPWWDYSRDAAYFVTICTQHREHFFGQVRQGEMHLSDIGQVAKACWHAIPEHFGSASSAAFVVMPNHVHGIVVLDRSLPVGSLPVGSLHATTLPPTTQPTNATTLPTNQPPNATAPPKNEQMAAISPKPGSLSTIIRSYKSAVTRQVRPDHPGFGWQSRFHDHIIRDQRSFDWIQQYINENPARWETDKLNNSTQ